MKRLGDYRLWAALSAAAVTAAVTLAPARSQLAAQSPTCNAPANLVHFQRPLSRVARRLASASDPLTIVAVGSSSTAGAGASSASATYPSRLQADLRHRYPVRKISVINHGVGGTEMGDMIAKFDQDIAAEKPDLVLWQLGTNSVLRDRTLDAAGSKIEEGLTKVKALGADVVLINPQYAPRVIVKPESAHMLDIISHATSQANINLFNRFEIMRHWRMTDNIPFNAFLSPDELHMNDWSYACVAKLLGSAIVDVVSRPALTATSMPVNRAR
jgi:acyl-CoA thioesterase I